MFGIGFPELVIILIIAFLVLGPEKIVGFSRALGRRLSEFKKNAERMEETVLSEFKKISEEESHKSFSATENEELAKKMEKEKKS